MKKIKWIFSVFCLLMLDACVKKEAVQPTKTFLFTVKSTKDTGIFFKNIIEEKERMNGLFYEYYYNGGGVAAGDLNGDGWSDLYFVSNLDKNHLYLNKGKMTFREVSKRSGVEGGYGFATGVTMVDVNSDGRLDLYICKSGQFEGEDNLKNELYINTGNNKEGIPTFKEVANEYGLDITLHSTQASFFDYDKDGDLDLLLANHGVEPFSEDNIENQRNAQLKKRGERLYRNDDGYFNDVSMEVGFTPNDLGYCLGISVGDLNNDTWPDVYVGIDYSGSDHLYINNRDGTFSEVIKETTGHIPYFSMGNDIADLNQDGRNDIIAVDMVAEFNYGIKANMGGMDPDKFGRHVNAGLHHQYMFNTLQINQGNRAGLPQFSDLAQISGVSNTDWSWAPLIMDLNNDGHRDIFISNGIKRNFRNSDFVQYRKQKEEEIKHKINKNETWDIAAWEKDLLSRMPENKALNYFYINDQQNFFNNFTNEIEGHKATISNGACYADLDNDGDLDIVVNNTDNVSFIYENNTNNNNYLKVELEYVGSNKKGFGTTVVLYSNRKEQRQELYSSRGFQSSVDPILHFGLGEHSPVDSLAIIWPNGFIQVEKGIEKGSTITIPFNSSRQGTIPKASNQALFTDVTKTLEVDFKHKENPFNDFDREVLLPHKMSVNGPVAAVGDVNGDGLEDIVIGSSVGNALAIGVQNDNGNFKFNAQSSKTNLGMEQTDVLLFDPDRDGDLDLLLVHGGHQYPAGHPLLEDQFFTNEDGRFQLAESVLPALEHFNGSVASCFDYDGDGDLDLFVGGHAIPEKYPFPANSKLYRNDLDQGILKFTDVTDTVLPALNAIGIVTDAVWTSWGAKQEPMLVVVGEWMPLRAFKFENGVFKDVGSRLGIDETVGWWNSITLADVDQDGDQDFLLGNLGLNSKFKSSPEAPFEVYATDVDKDASIDIILGYHEKGELFPVRGRSCSSQQVPAIKNKFKTYESFALANLKTIYGPVLEGALHYQISDFTSALFQNEGGNRLQRTSLPKESQVSRVQFITPFVGSDNETRFLVGGNFYPTEVETTRSDASVGLAIKFDHELNTEIVKGKALGVYLNSDVREAIPIHVAGIGPAILVLSNNDILRILKIN